MNIKTLTTELRDGLEGVTPGPWKMFVPDKGYCQTLVLTDCPELEATPENRYRDLVADCDDCTNGEDNAEHIARCSPDNIRTLLDSHDAVVEALEGLVAGNYARKGITVGQIERAEKILSSAKGEDQ